MNFTVSAGGSISVNVNLNIHVTLQGMDDLIAALNGGLSKENAQALQETLVPLKRLARALEKQDAENQ